MSSIKTNHDRMNKSVAASGAATMSCGDTVATVLEGRTLAVVHALANHAGIDATQYGHLNPGHQRMILGNMLRRKFRLAVAAYLAANEGAPAEEAEDVVVNEWSEVVDKASDQELAKAA